MTDPTSFASNAALDEVWNGEAGAAWVELSCLLDQQLHALGLETQSVLGLKPVERVLDIGCGGGETSIDLERAVLPGGAVLGVEISQLRPGWSDRAASTPRRSQSPNSRHSTPS